MVKIERCISEFRLLHLVSVGRSYNTEGHGDNDSAAVVSRVVQYTHTHSSCVCLTFIFELTILKTMYVHIQDVQLKSVPLTKP